MTAVYGRFPTRRMRRLREATWMRDVVRETRLAAADLIWPVFVTEGAKDVPIPSFYGVKRQCLATLEKSAKEADALGIRAVMLFPHIDLSLKDAQGAEATRSGNLVARATSVIKKAAPGLGVICDVALDPYTDHGHDGIIEDGRIHNDKSVDRLIEQSLFLAENGADMLAPSDMMDGRIGRIRQELDANGFAHMPIMSYAAKFASAYYGPFRQAVGSAPALGKSDKKTYQIEPANAGQAIIDAMLDADEGADILMVKPALPYLDMVATLRAKCDLPIFAYQVSAEYAMMKAGAEADLFNYEAMLCEQLVCCKRAGAAAIATYGALDVARLLGEGKNI